MRGGFESYPRDWLQGSNPSVSFAQKRNRAVEDAIPYGRVRVFGRQRWPERVREDTFV